MTTGTRDGFVGTIGNTPLIRLRRASEATGCEILGKAEFMNPGGSGQGPRRAVRSSSTPSERGRLRPGGVIVEATAGNTGIGLALVANARGYRTVIVIPQTQSQEKKDMLRQCGADLYEVPALPYRDPNNYVHVAGRLAEQLARSGAERRDLGEPVRQRRQPPGRTTRPPAPRSGRRRDGKIDGFICSVGTGGTLAGVAAALRERNARVKIGLADPPGAALYSYYTTGELKMEGTSITEGIGQGRITRNLEGLEIDFACQVPDTETVEMVFDLLQHEGLVLGSSSGINVAGAVRLARELGPGHVIVTALCDSGSRYASRLFNPEFLRAKQLPVPEWLESASAELPPGVIVR